jgi:hypothetical protein
MMVWCFEWTYSQTLIHLDITLILSIIQTILIGSYKDLFIFGSFVSKIRVKTMPQMNVLEYKRNIWVKTKEGKLFSTWIIN